MSMLEAKLNAPKRRKRESVDTQVAQETEPTVMLEMSPSLGDSQAPADSDLVGVLFRARRPRTRSPRKRVSIAVPLALTHRVDAVSKRYAGLGYLDGLNVSSLLELACDRVSKMPSEFQGRALELEADGSTRGLLQGGVDAGEWDAVRRAWWGLEPRPLTHGPLITAAVESILRELEGGAQ